MTDSRAKICEMRKENPQITQAQMADTIGVSRERVRQLLIDMGMPTVVDKTPKVNPWNKPRSLEIAPALLWIITEMLRPPAGKDDYIPRQTTQFRDYAQTVVNQASVCMTADATGWEKYLGQ
tara:strand:+ start:1366 stop:1731 length:366 start_codon:yes stop_codon:yes gene_type:complete